MKSCSNYYLVDQKLNILPSNWERLIESAFDVIQNHTIEIIEAHKLQIKQAILAQAKRFYDWAEKMTEPYSKKNSQAKKTELGMKLLIESVSFDSILKGIKNSLDKSLDLFSLSCDHCPQENREIIRGQNIDIQCDSIKNRISCPIDEEAYSDAIEYIEKHDCLVIGTKKNNLFTWNTKTFQRISSLQISGYWIRFVKSCPSKNYLFVACDNELHLFRVARGAKIQFLFKKKFEQSISSLLCIPKKELLLIGAAENTIHLLDTNTFNIKGSLSGQGQSYQAIYVNKYNLIIAGFSTGAIITYDLTIGSEYTTIQAKVEYLVIRVAFEEEKDLLFANVKPGKIRCWRLDYKEKNFTFVKEITFPSFSLLHMVPVNHGSQLVICSYSRAIQVFDMEKNESKDILEVEIEAAGMKFIPKKNMFVVTTQDKFHVIQYQKPPLLKTNVHH